MLVSDGAAFQLPSPACAATMFTTPVPANARFVLPVIVAGPPLVVKLTASPLDAVAARPTLFVVSWSGMDGNDVIAWSALYTVTLTELTTML